MGELSLRVYVVRDVMVLSVNQASPGDPLPAGTSLNELFQREYTKIVLDLISDEILIDSRIIGFMIRVHQLATVSARRVRYCVSEEFLQVFAITKLDRMVQTYTSVEKALADF